MAEKESLSKKQNHKRFMVYGFADLIIYILNSNSFLSISSWSTVYL